jgi:hypothetical protein
MGNQQLVKNLTDREEIDIASKEVTFIDNKFKALTIY